MLKCFSHSFSKLLLINSQQCTQLVSMTGKVCLCANRKQIYSLYGKTFLYHHHKHCQNLLSVVDFHKNKREQSICYTAASFNFVNFIGRQTHPIHGINIFNVMGRLCQINSFHGLSKQCLGAQDTLELRELSPLPMSSTRSVSKKTYVFPELKEEDLEESYMRGSGRGGQAVAKTNNCVLLKHKPTGLIVKCHATRSVINNRRIARERLQLSLDDHINGENSFNKQLIRERTERNKKRKAGAKIKHDAKRQMKALFKKEILGKKD